MENTVQRTADLRHWKRMRQEWFDKRPELRARVLADFLDGGPSRELKKEIFAQLLVEGLISRKTTWLGYSPENYCGVTEEHWRERRRRMGYTW